MIREKELLSKVVPLAEAYDMFPQGGTVVCALSGGLDSMCLMHFLYGMASRFGFQLHACHMNHQIRQEADADQAFVEAQCAQRSIPIHTRTEDVPMLAQQWGLGLEETGRILRYQFFEELAEDIGGEVVIATAHHADDNAETMLLHLVRGTGLNGLGGIPPRRGRVVRPFLNVSRQVLNDYAEEQKLEHVEDATNADPAYARNFIRLKVIPLLKELNPGLTDTLAADAATLRRDGEYLNEKAESIAQECTVFDNRVILPIRTIKDQPAAIAGRVVQLVLERLTDEVVLSAAQRDAVIQLCRADDPSGHLDLPCRIAAQRCYEAIAFSREVQQEVLEPVLLTDTGVRMVGPWKITVEKRISPEYLPKNGYEFYLPESEPVLLRPRAIGDDLKLPHRTGRKSLKKWMIEAKIPQEQRDLIPVLEQNGQVAAVYGFGRDDRCAPEPGTPCMYITIKGKREDILL